MVTRWREREMMERERERERERDSQKLKRLAMHFITGNRANSLRVQSNLLFYINYTRWRQYRKQTCCVQEM